MKTVGDIGERKLIEIMLGHLTPMPEMPVPFWDDVMAVGLGDGRAVVLNTDMLVWETDIPRGMTHLQAARKAVVMNFSDLGAKGVPPLAFLSSLGLPRETPIEAVEEMAKGFEAGVREYGGYVIGGDTNEAREIIISGVALGVGEESKLMTRDGAEPRDILAVTGPFGETAAAFKILLEGYEAPNGLEEPLLGSVYTPRARVDEGVALADSGAASSSIDSSDGLAMSLHDLSRSSGVGFRLDSLPVSQKAQAFAEHVGLDAGDLALYGGEEYELVFTVKPHAMNEAVDSLKSVGCEPLVIGEVTASRRIVFMEEGVERTVGKSGWDHFKG